MAGTVASEGGSAGSGALQGAALGSVIPGIGTGIGAGLGALNGIIAGLGNKGGAPTASGMAGPQPPQLHGGGTFMAPPIQPQSPIGSVHGQPSMAQLLESLLKMRGG